MKVHRIKVTRGEAQILEWAIGPMRDFFEEQVALGDRMSVPPLPKLLNHTLYLPDDRDTIHDLFYRVTEQYPDMAEQAGAEISPQMLAAIRSMCARLRDKLQKHLLKY